MKNYYSFDEQAISHALNSAKQTHAGLDLTNLKSDSDLSRGGDLQVQAQCISVKVEDNKICLNLPFGFGKHCLHIPISIPNGTAANACLSICTTWGIPTGIKVAVTVAGVTVISQTFGKC
ncbi:MAG: hypothetical protein CMC55_02815 [Flavobacteriaceae bacterium]|uniref:hypothetical protein n=1 Tax=Bizionia echini TaxID=649333 RepID=UPI000C8B9E04|nr:hypothetical protein [Flavobacteriaceae bacterium]|tara:strand:- start:91 stop:450 length:360 start_codon:yes stop_codon:yes gene_type:complete